VSKAAIWLIFLAGCEMQTEYPPCEELPPMRDGVVAEIVWCIP